MILNGRDHPAMGSETAICVYNRYDYIFLIELYMVAGGEIGMVTLKWNPGCCDFASLPLQMVYLVRCVDFVCCTHVVHVCIIGPIS